MTASRTKPELKSRVEQWAARLDVRVTSVTVRPMRRKWASCSSAGALSFSDDLLTLEHDLVDYVIVHELVHLRVPNHGRLWKSLMLAHLGEYEQLHQRLRTIGRERSA